MKFINRIYQQAAEDKKVIVLPEGNDERMIKAIPTIVDQDIANIILLGEKDEVEALAQKNDVDLTSIEVINPANSAKLDEYSNLYYQKRKHKGITLEQAEKKAKDPLYFAALMVENGDADGKVAGASNVTGNVLRAAIKVIGTAEGISVVSGAFVMILPENNYGENGMLVFADCAVNPNPNAEKLSEIAISSAQTAQNLAGIDPKVAMLSFSTNGSAKHELVDKVSKATELAKKNSQFLVEGEMQADAAIVPKVSASKFPGSKLAGKANVLVFPDLQSGNISYKLIQRLAGAEAIGPILQGIAKPVNDLSRGCSVEDIVNVTAITAVQAQKKIDQEG